MIHFTSLQEKIKEHKSPSNASSHSFLVVTKNGLFFFFFAQGQNNKSHLLSQPETEKCLPTLNSCCKKHDHNHTNAEAWQ